MGCPGGGNLGEEVTTEPPKAAEKKTMNGREGREEGKGEGGRGGGEKRRGGGRGGGRSILY